MLKVLLIRCLLPVAVSFGASVASPADPKSSCESLAKIRKMAIPAVQVNIGDKQINVAGDLKPGTTEIINV